jgi:NADH-quinone oxidoreductase subunit G
MSEVLTKPDLVTIVIDGDAVQVPAGTNIIAAAAKMGKEIPHYCYHPRLSISGNCRMCLVEVGMVMKDRATGEVLLDDKGAPKIGWSPKPAIACGTQAVNGLYIRTDTELVKDCQKGVMEFLLVNHPLDCPICDQAGECSLQEFATDYGRGYSRFIEDKNVKPKQTLLGPRVMLDDERCILCARCIRFSKEIAGQDVLGFVDRGSYSTLTCYPGKALTNNYSLNTVDICPVGALTSTDFRFQMRVWFLKKTPSICTESSVGVNTTVWSREGKIYRITPRENEFVNDSWMPDSGRELYKQVEAEDRLKSFKINGNTVSLNEAIDRACELLDAAQRVAYIASGSMTVEEHSVFKSLIAVQPGEVYGVSHIGEGDELLISKDRTPNMRGAFAMGLWNSIPPCHLQHLKEKIDAGAIDTLVVYHEDLLTLGLSENDLRKLNVIFLGTHAHQTARMATVVLPTLTVFEKSGTFINQQWRLQKFHQAISGPAGLLPDICILEYLKTHLAGEDYVSVTCELIWAKLKQEHPLLSGVDYPTFPELGYVLDASAYRDLSFVEGKSLHYHPASCNI